MGIDSRVKHYNNKTSEEAFAVIQASDNDGVDKTVALKDGEK